MSSYRTRIRQGLTALFHPQPPPGFPARWSEGIPDDVRAEWERLPAYDQHHLIAVATDLESAGHDSRTVLAGLLHDIGKAGAIVLPARVLAVLLKAIAPQVALRIRRINQPVFGFKGLHLLLNHAERGAALLETQGMDARVVWLVRHHEGDLPDTDLEALQASDNRH